jgi:hypothetical protein
MEEIKDWINKIKEDCAATPGAIMPMIALFSFYTGKGYSSEVALTLAAKNLLSIAQGESAGIAGQKRPTTINGVSID